MKKAARRSCGSINAMVYLRGHPGDYDRWAANGAQQRLAAVIALDQFSRNIFRGTPAAFEHDAIALRLCKDAIANGDALRRRYDGRLDLIEGRFGAVRAVGKGALPEPPFLDEVPLEGVGEGGVPLAEGLHGFAARDPLAALHRTLQGGRQRVQQQRHLLLQPLGQETGG